MDVEMPVPEDYGEKLVKLIENGKVTMEQIDRMLLRVLKTKLYYITRKDPVEYSNELIGAAEHVKLAETVAEESMVLLKNDGDILPFNKSSIRNLAVIGTLANVEVTGDKAYHVNSRDIVSPLEGFKNSLGKEVRVDYCSGENIEEAKAMVRRSDALVIIAGFSLRRRREHQDRID
jgi:beta-glucosidase